MSHRRLLAAAVAAIGLAFATMPAAAQHGGRGSGGAGGHGHWSGGGGHWGGGGGAQWGRGRPGGGNAGAGAASGFPGTPFSVGGPSGGGGGAAMGYPGTPFSVGRPAGGGGHGSPAGHGHGHGWRGAAPVHAPAWRGPIYGGSRIGIGIGVGVGGGSYYAPRAYYDGWARSRIGVYVPVLPSVYSTWYYGGSPYYYADGLYYAPVATGGYTVVDPPPGAAAAAAALPPSPPAPVIYPRLGQSAEQTEFDRRECNRWATEQPDAVADASVFQRTVEACMDGRGYTMR